MKNIMFSLINLIALSNLHVVDNIDGRDSDDETYDPANLNLEEYF